MNNHVHSVDPWADARQRYPQATPKAAPNHFNPEGGDHASPVKIRATRLANIARLCAEGSVQQISALARLAQHTSEWAATWHA